VVPRAARLSCAAINNLLQFPSARATLYRQMAVCTYLSCYYVAHPHSVYRSCDHLIERLCE